MKKQFSKVLKVEEKYYRKKNNLEINNKYKKQKPKYINTNRNNSYLTKKPSNDTLDNINNFELKTKLIRILSERNIYNFKNRYHKKFTYDKMQKKNEVYKSTLNNDENQNKENIPMNNNIIKDRNKSKILYNKEKFGIKQDINNIKSGKRKNKIINNKNPNNRKKKLLYNEKDMYIYGNKTMNELNYKENNDIYLKNKKGTFSYNTIIHKTNENNKVRSYNCSNNFENSKICFGNNDLIKKMKERKIKDKDNSIDIDIESKSKSKEIKNKNDIILLNFRIDKRHIFTNRNRISTSSEREYKFKNNASKILEFLRNKKSEKIMLKQKNKQNIEKERINSDKPIENQIKEKIENNSNDIKKMDIKNIEDKNNDDGNIEDNSNDNINFKPIYHSRNKYKKNIEEVKQKKNMIQRIIKRKINQSIREISQTSKLNRENNLKTYRDISMRSIFSKKFCILKNINDKNNHQEILSNNNITSNSLSNKKENIYNKIYLSLKTEEKPLNINKNSKNIYDKYNTYNKENIYYRTNDNLGMEISEKYDENHGVKTKRIKLDKLKNKFKQNSLNSDKEEDNNINSNLNPNNNKLNSNNSQKIYTQKKVAITKQANINVLSGPFYLSQSPDYKTNTIVTKISRISNKNDNINKTYVNCINPFNELDIFDNDTKNNTINSISKNNKNEFYNNISNDATIINNSRYNEEENIRNILYSKAAINKISEPIFNNINKNIISNRCRTIRYIKKSKNRIERINSNKNIKDNKIIKVQEMQIGISSKPSEKSFNVSEKNEPINFNLNTPFIRQKSYYKFKTFLSNETKNINLNSNEFNKRNSLNSSHFELNNLEDPEDNLITKKYNTGTYHLGYNFNNDKIMNNITGSDDIFCIEKNEIKLDQILYLLNFEDLLILEDKLNLILILLESEKKNYEEFFDLWMFFFSSNLKYKLEQIFKYFVKDTENFKEFINYSLIFIMICYDYSINLISLDLDNNISFIEIAKIIYTNILIIINSIKSKISLDNKDNYNIRLIEMSKINTIIKNKISHMENDILFIKGILYANATSVIKKINSIININRKNDKLKEKYNSEFFKKIKYITFDEINKYFQENILNEGYLGCSILACTFLKEKQHLRAPIVPYLLTKNKKNYSLIVDLDETLIHFTINTNENNEGILKLRPGVFSFLEKVGEFYEIILFTEASEAYTQLILEAFNKKNKNFFDYKLYRQHCNIEEQDFIKDLSKIGRPLDKTIIIDNIAQNFKLQKNNGIAIKPFLGEDQNDQALIDLIPILVNIARDDIDVRNGLLKYRDEIITKISSNLFRRNRNK